MVCEGISLTNCYFDRSLVLGCSSIRRVDDSMNSTSCYECLMIPHIPVTGVHVGKNSFRTHIPVTGVHMGTNYFRTHNPVTGVNVGKNSFRTHISVTGVHIGKNSSGHIFQSLESRFKSLA